MNKKNYIRLLSVILLLVSTLTFGWSYFTDYKISQLKTEGGISLEVQGDDGISKVSQSGYRVQKDGIGWYKNGDSATVTASVRNGYTFHGWYNSGTKVSSNLSHSFSVTEPTILTAKTTVNSYTITAELDGGTIDGSSTWSKTYTVKDTVTLPTPTKVGHTFLGWVEKGGNAVPNPNYTISVGTTGNKTFVAKWSANKYELDINGRLDNGSIEPNIKGMGTLEVYVNGILANAENANDYCRDIAYGSQIEIKNIKAYEGKTFKSSSHSLKFTMEKPVKITLDFKTNEYTYRFDPNGGTGTGSDIKLKHGETLNIPKLFTRDFYTQTCWTRSADGSGTKYDVGGKYSGYSGKDGDIVTLYAQWRKNKVRISLHANGSKMGVNAGSYYGIDAQSFITMGGNRAAYGGEYDGYIGNSSTNSLPDIQSTGNMWLERTGYYYIPTDAYNTKSDGSGKSYSDDGGILAKDVADLKDSDKSVTFYANWKPNNYKVRYNGNGATSGTMADSSYVYDTAKSLTRNTFAKTGYTFTGWNTKADGKGTAYADGASVKNLTSSKDGVVTLYAQWKANRYILTYNANGGTVSTSSKTLEYGDAFGTLPTPKRDGHKFLGWYTSATGGTKVSEATKIGAENTTIYAHWDAYTLSINYHADGAEYFSDYDLNNNKELGTINVAGKDIVKVQTVKYGSKLPDYGILDGNRFTKTGHTAENSVMVLKDGTSLSVIEPYTAIELATKAGKQEAFKTEDVSIDIYPKWVINWYSNKVDHWAWGFRNQEGNNGGKNEAYKIDTTSFDAVFNTTFIMDGSKQTTLPKGFHLQNKFGTSAIDGTWQNYPLGTKVTQSAKSLRFAYAYSPTTYKIAYNLNGGTNNSDNPSSYNVLYGVSLKNPTRQGYTFSGWYNGGTKVTGINEGKGANFASSAELYSELEKRTIGDVTLEARWTPTKYTLTFNPNGGTVNPTSKTVSYGSPYGDLPTPTKSGNTFLGWFTEKDGGTKVSSTTTMGASNVTLYAHWNPSKCTYNVVYKSSSGLSLGTDTVQGTLGSTVTVDAPSKTGYITPSSQKVTFDSTNAKTITFLYRLIEYSISYNLDGGTEYYNPTDYTVETPTFTLNAPVKAGSYFTGWTGSNGSYKETLVTISKGSTGNRTYTANWEAIKYTVSFEPSGDFDGLNKTYTVGQALGVLPTPTMEGYKFLGWYYQDEYGVEVKATSSTVVTENMYLYARWEELLAGDSSIMITDNLTHGRGVYSVRINNGTPKDYSAGESFTCNKGDKIEVNARVPDLGAEPDSFDCTGPNGNSLMNGYTWTKVDRNSSVLTGTVDKTGYISFYYLIIFA